MTLYVFINPKSDLGMSPSRPFSQYTRMAAVCQWVCGGAPGAWCRAKGSSGLMRVAPAATGLRFIYLGTGAGTQETQQASDLALEAADITGNIKLPYHVSSFKWKLHNLRSHAFTMTLLSLSLSYKIQDIIHFP